MSSYVYIKGVFTCLDSHCKLSCKVQNLDARVCVLTGLSSISLFRDLPSLICLLKTGKSLVCRLVDQQSMIRLHVGGCYLHAPSRVGSDSEGLVQLWGYGRNAEV